MSRKPISTELWVLFLNDYDTHRDIGRAAARAGFNRVTVYRKMKSDSAFAAAVALIRRTPPPEPAPPPPPSAESTALLIHLLTIRGLARDTRQKTVIERNPQ